MVEYSRCFPSLLYDAIHIRVSAADQYINQDATGNAREDAYYGNITHLDAAIGRLLTALNSLHFTENTLLFFSSDNGPDVLRKWEATYYCYGTSYPLYGQKYQLFEGGIRVPGLVRWPGKIEPGISDEPNSTLDILPTLYELVDRPLPAELTPDGSSILSHLLDGSKVDRVSPLYWQFDGPTEFEIIGKGNNRQLDGSQRKQDQMSPRIVIWEGNYVLRGLHNDSIYFT